MGDFFAFLHSFRLAFYKCGNYESQNKRCGDSHRRCRESAREYSKRADLVYGLLDASCNSRAKSDERDGYSCAENLKKRLV